MGAIYTYARAIKIHEIGGTNPVITKADVLLSTGVIEHQDWNSHRDREEIRKLVNHYTHFIDEHDDDSCEALCKFYVVNP